MSIEERVRKIVYEYVELDDKSKEISDDTPFTDWHLDSLDAVELIMSLEEEFDCEIADEDAEKITSITLAIEYIKKNV